nr:dehydration-responsive element-binding protein 2A-like [Ipomoea batatas]
MQNASASDSTVASSLYEIETEAAEANHVTKRHSIQTKGWRQGVLNTLLNVPRDTTRSLKDLPTSSSKLLQLIWALGFLNQERRDNSRFNLDDVGFLDFNSELGIW